MPVIKKLDSKLIDQIAAGEVVDRPASVLKELLDNAIDANSTKITIRIQKGGTKQIEVADNGIGMSREDLEIALNSHTTSKIETIQDLIDVSTFGFRGEALSSISSVSKVCVATMPKDVESQAGYQLIVEGGTKQGIKSVSREQGTTITIDNLFFNIPARQKFIKTPQTEYRYILKTFLPMVLIHPHVHFILEHDGRQVYNLPAINGAKPGMIHPQRVKEVLPGTEFVDVFHDGGEVVTVGGVVGHPKHHAKRAKSQYVFVNNRPVWDRGIVKAVSIGASRFIPDGHALPFILAVNTAGKNVDVNVHPRKSEVKFANPFRAFSAVEQAVKKAYEVSLGREAYESDSDREYSRFRNIGVVRGSSLGSGLSGKQLSDRSVGGGDRGESAMSSGKNYNVRQSLEFSKMILQDSGDEVVSDDSVKVGDSEVNAEHKRDQIGLSDKLQGELGSAEGDIHIRARQFLNRYIVTALGDELLVIDQHAAAERVRFEQLLIEYGVNGVEVQKVLVPEKVELSGDDIEFVKENAGVLERLGFEVTVGSGAREIEITGVPVVLVNANFRELFEEILGLMHEFDELGNSEGVLRDEYRDSVIATMACHSSVRMNRHLEDVEAEGIVKSLFKCQNAYSCPHGRPIAWKIPKDEIDSRFER